MITLINPPSPFLINQKAFPPLGLLYIASSLEKENFGVEFLDLSNKEDDLDYELLEIEGIDPIFITSTTPQYPYAKLINDIIKTQLPDSVTIIGGAHASANPEECLRDGFNHIVVGEGEEAAIQIAEAYERGRKVGKIIELHEKINLDMLPFPDRSLIDIASYGYPLNTGMATTVITSRGCPHECAFCAKGTMSRRVRFHSPKYIEAELKNIIDTYGFRNFLFVDDCFTLGKQRLEEILEKIKLLEINWRCYARADQMNRDTLQKMKDAGCVEIGVGIESGSQKILNTVGKHTKVEKNLQLVKDMREVGITSNTFVILGLPGETPETVRETRQFMETARPDKFGYNIFIPYTGTKIYQNKDKGIYDIEVYDMLIESTWAKGKERMPKSFVRTKELSREDIDRIYDEEFKHFTELTNFRPGVGKI